MMLLKYNNRKKGIVHFKNALHFFCLITIFFLFSSCEQEMNIEIKTNDKRLLIDGEFTTDSVIHSIRLYCSGSLITGKPQTTVSDAKVCVTDKIDTFYYVENEDTLGLYQTVSKCFGKGGHNYTLTITNIDIDKDGKTDFYTSDNLMPVPIKYDSLVSKHGYNGDTVVVNLAYYKLYFNGPGYVYPFAAVNNYIHYGTITDRLGTGEINRFEHSIKVPQVSNPDSTINLSAYFALPPSWVKKGDTISFICLNLTNDQYSFLKEFDNNTSGNDAFNDNLYDQLRMPANLPTNIEPSNKAAGYFFVYSQSIISKVFNEE